LVWGLPISVSMGGLHRIVEQNRIIRCNNRTQAWQIIFSEEVPK
jgi:hypothetical protein